MRRLTLASTTRRGRASEKETEREREREREREGDRGTHTHTQQKMTEDRESGSQSLRGLPSGEMRPCKYICGELYYQTMVIQVSCPCLLHFQQVVSWTNHARCRSITTGHKPVNLCRAQVLRSAFVIIRLVRLSRTQRSCLQ